MLFHKSIGLPKSMVLPKGRKRLFLTYHAQAEAQKDKGGNILPLIETLFHTFDPAEAELIEVETEDRVNVEKAVYRQKATEGSDLVFAIAPYSDRYVAKTVWTNKSGDRHKTLDLRRYSKP